MGRAIIVSAAITELVDIEPLHVAAYVEALQETAAKVTGIYPWI